MQAVVVAMAMAIVSYDHAYWITLEFCRMLGGVTL
jgi:hypothetical protein